MRRLALVAAAIGLIATSCGGGTETPSFEAETLPGGTPVSLDEFDGVPVLLAAFATWCLPCERELPALDAAADDWATMGVRVVAVNVDDPATDDGAVLAMVDRLDVTLPVWRDRDLAFLTTFDGTMMPFSVLVDGDGAIVRTWTGAVDPDGDDVREAIERVATA